MIERVPALFVGHGSPMLTLGDNKYTLGWRKLGAALPRPRAILVISAHWYVNASVATAMPQPKTIHDFYGFPDELFAVQYPAPGSPKLAEAVVKAADPIWVGLDRDSWGLDHGTWSVLRHMYPDADIPVVQLSLDAVKSTGQHLELAAKLAPLRDRGVLIIGSGNIVHNLRMVQWNAPGTGADWAIEFDNAARAIATTDPGRVAELARHQHYPLAVPTPDHFLPFVYLCGIAAAGGGVADPVIEGYDLGSLSMTSYWAS